jgi:hypothetical protein
LDHYVRKLKEQNMALTQDITIQVGSKEVVFTGAYAKVTEYHGDKVRMTFVVSWSESAGESAIRQSTFGCAVDLNGDNPIRQAYLHLKTLPEFADAVDC